jgi:hypothetical protein
MSNDLEEIGENDTYGRPTVCALKTWQEGVCPDCYYNGEYAGCSLDVCPESERQVGHRVLFVVDDDKEPLVIKCIINECCVFDKPDNKPNPLDGTSLSRVGEEVKWVDRFDKYSGISTSESFEFCETMDNSQVVDVFESHTSILADILGITTIASGIRGCVTNSLIKRKKNKLKNNSKYDIEKIEQYLSRLKSSCADIIRAHLLAIYAQYKDVHTHSYYPENFRKGIKYVDKIAEMVANALVECEARKDCYPISQVISDSMQKPCPHVSKVR